MIVEIYIQGDNAAFINEDNAINTQEYARILKEISDKISKHYPGFSDPVTPEEFSIRDINENKVGFWRTL